MSGLGDARRGKAQSGPAPVRVEILIINYNGGQLLTTCLESIAHHLPMPGTVKVSITVLDNASSDGSVTRLRDRFPDVRLLESSNNVGFARGCNRLTMEATADFLMLLNPDVRFTEDIITPLLETMSANPDISVVGPRLVYPDGKPQFSSERFPTLTFELARALRGTKLGRLFEEGIDATLARFRRRREIEGRLTHRADFLWATCWLLRRDEVQRHGLFDEAFVTYDEDLDFCRRLRRRGGRAVYVASTELVHVGGASSTSEEKRKMVRAARQQYYRRHRGLGGAFAYGLLAGSVDRVKARQ